LKDSKDEGGHWNRGDFYIERLPVSSVGAPACPVLSEAPPVYHRHCPSSAHLIIMYTEAEDRILKLTSGSRYSKSAVTGRTVKVTGRTEM
jgi:hypothetical protein